MIEGLAGTGRSSACGAIIDLDDTLYPHESFVASGFRALACHLESRYALPAATTLAVLRDARAGATRGQELQVLCRHVELPVRLVPQFRNVIRAHEPDLRLPAPSAWTLARLRARGWRIVVLTNGTPGIQRRKVAALDLVPLVHHVVYAEEHSRGGKPAARPFREALARLGLPAGRCVAVGDDPVNDVLGARALGIRTIRVRRPGRRPTVPDADAVVSDLAEVPAVVTAVLEAADCDAA